jgi:F0F1-type ATP synthase delta subunit
MRLTLEQRTAALLALVEEYRAKRCAELLDPARSQARTLLRNARAEGRQRVHTTIGEARQRLAGEVGAAQARLATERRLAEQRHAVLVLQQAWSALREALRARWRDAAARRQWLDAHLARALRVLPRERRPAAAEPLAAPGGDGPPAEAGTVIWQVEFAADLGQAEREAFAARIAAAGVANASWQAREDIDGGVRIRAGNNVVDATIEGLLADRAALEGRLLDLLQEGSPAQPRVRAGGETLAFGRRGAG